jgi:hypothetical protein
MTGWRNKKVDETAWITDECEKIEIILIRNKKKHNEKEGKNEYDDVMI